MENATHMSQLPESFIKEVAANYGVTRTELDTLLLALNDYSGAKIAEQLNISQPAVRKRLGESYRKFGIEGSSNKKLTNLKQRLIAQYQAGTVTSTPCEDWGEAVDVEGFQGREKEITQDDVGARLVRLRPHVRPRRHVRQPAKRLVLPTVEDVAEVQKV